MGDKVTAVITTFNRASIVVDAIKSVFEQTHAVDELLVVDDGSQDETEASVRAAFATAPVPCRYIRKENGGMASALNFAIDEANGDWLAFLDDDDLWSGDHIERCIRIAALRSDVGCVCGLREEKGALQVPPPPLLLPYSAENVDGPVLIKAQGPLVRPFFTPVVGTSLVKARLLGQIRFQKEAGARLDIHFFWCLSTLTAICLDMRSHGVGRQFRTSYLSTDDNAPQTLKDEIALKRSTDEIRMLRLLLRNTPLAPNNEFAKIYRQTLLGRTYVLRSMGRYSEGLKWLRHCVGKSSTELVLKEALLCIARIRPRSAIRLDDPGA